MAMFWTKDDALGVGFASTYYSDPNSKTRFLQKHALNLSGSVLLHSGVPSNAITNFSPDIGTDFKVQNFSRFYG